MQNLNIFLSPKIVFILAKLADTYEMPQYVAFHLCLLSLPVSTIKRAKGKSAFSI